MEEGMGNKKRSSKPVTGTAGGASANTFGPLSQSFLRDNRQRNLSKRTLDIRAYAYGAFSRWMELNERSLAVEAITREDVQDYLAFMQEHGYADATVRSQYLSLHVFFRWLAEEGEIDASPCERMKTPEIEQKVVPLMSDDDIQRLLKACDGKTFDDRRDKAMILLFLDTGMRRGELVAMQFDDLNLEEQSILVHGKGKIERLVAFGNHAAHALDAYLRARMKHKHAHMDAVWITSHGAMYNRTVNVIFERRAKQAGLGRVWPHLMRHQFTHLFLAAGGQERSVMALNGWRSPAMLGRYGASLAAQRARDEHKRLSPGDKFK
jgi:site-specific recombinase XerD